MLGTGLLAAMIMTVLHAKLGYVRLLGVGHFVWIPMLIWLVYRLDHIPGGTFFSRLDSHRDSCGHRVSSA